MKRMAQFGGDASMPIAVIGMGCRFPGDATSPDRLWELLVNGRNAWSEFPKDRINIDGFYHPSGDRQGSICFKGGHFLKEDAAAWDAPFFSTTAHEAAAMDPQQRILLEVSYEAFENAGVPMESLPGSSTAVYCGSFVKDYEQVVLRDPDNSPQYAATGNGIAIMSNRISWFYDLNGPSMTLDTGCSASLVGVHLACQSLRTGESTMAIAMGAGLILTPSTMMPMTALNFLSPDGKCFTFDERANGYGRGEGIGAVVLKPLEAALRDNDTIRAVIRGSAVNQDGRTPGITMPSKDAQAMNIRAVYKAAGLGYDRTAYFEAHGTGTQAGDPTELGAISETFAETRNSEEPIFVGSVKTNIGHLEGCAGIAGLVKGVLMLEKGLIPPNLYFEKVNPKIDLEAWKIKVPTSLTPWPLDGLRRVSINCFGFGGTNAHIILDDALHYLANRGLKGNHYSADLSPSPTPSLIDSWVEIDSQNSNPASVGLQVVSVQRHKLYVLSSHEENGISRLSAALFEYLQRKCTSALFDEVAEQLGSDLAYTLSCRRSRLPWKSFLVSSSVPKLVSRIEEAISKPFRSSQAPNIAFVFSGQGAQWFGMGRELLEYETYSKSMQEADTYLKSIGSEWSLMTELLKDEHTSIVNLPRISQPLCTALQLALIDLLKYWNIEHRAVVGHSSGEIAAAYALGALSREDCLKLAFHRGRLTSAMKYLDPTLKGRMMAVALPKDTAESFVENLNCGKAVVACINSPENVTVSGDESAVLELEKILAEEGIFARLLKVENAYHSSHMRLVESYYLHAIQDIQVLEAVSGRKMFSSVTGVEIDIQELGPEYWARNLVSPVNFSDAMSSLISSRTVKPDILLELGPHAVLQAPVKQILDADTKSKYRPMYVSMLHRGKDAIATSLEAVGHLWTHGYPANLELANKSVLDKTPSVLIDLPTYPWNHAKTYWHESHLGSDYRFRKHGREDLIGAPTVEGTFFEPQWRGFIRVSENPWVQDHQVQNTIIYPAAGMMVMALEGVQQIQNDDHQVDAYEILNMSIEKAMLIPSSTHGLETKLNMKRLESERSPNDHKIETFDFTIYSKFLDAAWQKNCSGLLNIQYKAGTEDQELDVSSGMNEYLEEYLSHQGVCTETIPARQLYEALETIGMKYGSTFQNITSVQKRDNVSCTTVRIPDSKSRMPGKYEYPHLIHPATLDAMFQTVFVAGNEPMVPSHLDSLFISADFPQGAGAELRGYSIAARKGLRDATGNIIMSDGSWDKPKLVVKGLHFTALSTAVDDTTERGFFPNHHNLCTEIVWKEDIATANPTLLSEWLELISFKYPAMNILDTSCGDADSMFSRLKILGGLSDIDPRFSRCTFTSTSEEALERDQKFLEYWRDYVDFKILDPTTDLLKEGFKARSFDLVFSNHSDHKSGDALRGLLKPGGRFVHLTSKTDAGSTCDVIEDQADLKYDDTSVAPELEEDGHPDPEVSQPDLILRVDTRKETLEVKVFNLDFKATQPVPLASREVMILLPTDPSQELQDLFLRLKEALLLSGAKITSSTLTNPDISISGKLCLALLEVDSPLISNWTEGEFHAFRLMISEAKGCLWITKGGQMKSNSPFSAPVTALFRAIISEDPQKALITLDLDAETDLCSESTGRAILSTFLKSFDPHKLLEELEYAESGGKIFIPRVILDEHLSSRIEYDGKPRAPKLQPFFQLDRPLQLEVGMLGKFESLHFNNDTTAVQPLGLRNVEIRVQATGINQLDAKTALGQTTHDTIGSDVSGVVTRISSDVSKFKVGDRVVTIVPGAFKTLVRSHESAVQLMPEEMSFETAASLPSDFMTALYAIATVGRLQEEESILINGGCASFMQAAVQIAKNIGAEIFVMVASSEERTLFCETQRIQSDHVFNARSRISKGSKFDLVLNSLQGSLRNQALGCVQEYGRFVEIETHQNQKNDSMKQIPQLANITYSTVDLSSMIKSNTPLISRLLNSTFDMIKDGLIHQTTTLQTLDFSKLTTAFQVAIEPNQKHKVVLKANGNDIVPVIPRDEHPLDLSSTATYVLVGGLGGIGRSLALLLITHGAKNLAFISRSGAVSSAQVSFISSLKSQNINARVYNCDICDSAQLSTIIKQCSEEMPPIRGVIQGAAVVRDAIFENMTYEDWISATRPKIQGSWNLHTLLPSSLDFFVFLSSSAGVIGARGQSNYAAGNAFQDSLAHNRRSSGLKAVSLDLGPILGVGMVAEDEATLDILRQSGFIGIREKDLHILLVAAMTGYTQDGNDIPAQVIVGTGTGGLIKQNAVPDPYWHNSPMFSVMRGVDLAPSYSDSSSEDSVSMQELLSASASFGEAIVIVTDGLAQLFAKSMNMSPADLDTGRPANAYGVDSLVAVGTRNWIFRETGVDVSVFEILSENSITQLAKRIAKDCRFVATELKEEIAEDS